MKALSLWQPWASFIAAGIKQYETRHWTTRYRGLVAIHAANHGVRGFSEAEWRHIERLKFEHPEIRTVMATPLPFGAILCVCELEAIYKTEAVAPYLRPLELSDGDYSEGRAAWKLKMVKVFDEPIPVRGAQGLWEWSESREGAPPEMQQLALPLKFADAVSPYERDVVARRLRELNRRWGPVRSPMVAAWLGISERTARHYLAHLEKAGYVRRPEGPRSGWAAAI